jgi:hypothetical protein
LHRLVTSEHHEEIQERWEDKLILVEPYAVEEIGGTIVQIS